MPSFYVCNRSKMDLSELELSADPMFWVALAAFLVAWKGLVANVQANRVKNSLDFESTYKHNEASKKSSDEVLHFITAHRKLDLREKTTELALQGSRKNEDDDSINYYAAINDFLNEWERCANGIYHGVFDEDILYGTYCTTVVEPIKLLLPFIIIRQQKRERVYIKLLWLSLRWQIRNMREKGQWVQIPKQIFKAYEYLDEHHRAIYNRHKVFRYVYKFLYRINPSENLKYSRYELCQYIEDTNKK